MNLELTKNNSTQNSQNALLLERQVQRLKEQNKQLTQEVGHKSNQVTALEQEKRTLIKQLSEILQKLTYLILLLHTIDKIYTRSKHVKKMIKGYENGKLTL